MAPTSYLISGTNRGIGLVLVEALALQGNAIIFAGTRNPATSTALNELASKYPGAVYPLLLRSADEEDARYVVKVINEKVGMLDVVIANAGMIIPGLASEIPIQEVRDHFEVNALGPLVLYQATLPLLRKSSNPKFIGISSYGGSQACVGVGTFTVIAYGASKAAMNNMLLRMHKEEPGLIVFPIHPGMVDTDMGAIVAPAAGDFWQGTTPAKSAEALLAIIQKATREEHSGRFWNVDGTEIPW